MEIREITKEELGTMRCLVRESVDVKYNPNAHYIGAFISGKLVGVCGYQYLSKNVLRYKTDGVLPNYRGMGIYTTLFRYRDELLGKTAKVITAFCTKMSLPCYLANGFEIVKSGRITFVKR